MNGVAAQGGSNSGLDIVIWLALVVAYWVPTMVAWIRHVPNKGSVTVVNALLGWSVIGWIVALAMACRSIPQENPAAPFLRGEGSRMGQEGRVRDVPDERAGPS